MQASTNFLLAVVTKLQEIADNTADLEELNEYGKGDKVFHKGTEYELMWGNGKGISPEQYIHWKAVGGQTPAWSKNRGYLEGDKVIYNGAVYEAIKPNGGGKQPDICTAEWKKTGESAPQAKKNLAVSNKMVKNSGV